MAFVPAANTWECTVKGLFAGQPWANVFHIRDSGEAFGPTAEDIAARAFNGHSGGFDGICGAGVSWTSCIARFLGIEFGEVAEFVPVAPVVGTATGQNLPANVAFLVQKRTGRSGRAYRGRMYLPGVTEDQTSAGTGGLAAATVTSLQAAAQAWFDTTNGTIDGAAVNLVLASFIQGGVDRASAEVTELSAVTASPFVATMRERLKRGG